jgi:hypothetical protein
MLLKIGVYLQPLLELTRELQGIFALDFGEDEHPSLPQPPSVVWAGEIEYNPPGITLVARNEMIHD